MLAVKKSLNYYSTCAMMMKLMSGLRRQALPFPPNRLNITSQIFRSE